MTDPTHPGLTVNEVLIEQKTRVDAHPDYVYTVVA